MNSNGSSRTLRIAAAAVALFLLGQVALSANSIGPPAQFWFTLNYETPARPALQGAQIVGCADVGCAEPTLIKQFGRCDGVGCLSTPVAAEWDTKFECAENLCRFAFRSLKGVYVRLVLQFSDRTRLSAPVGPLEWQYGTKKAWRVGVGESSLTLREDPNFTAPGTNYDLFLFALLLTVVVEVLVAAAFLRFVVKTDAARTKRALTIVGLINLITLPVVWYTFPSWGRFQSGTARSMGWVVLALFVAYALLLIGIFRSEGKQRRTLVILTILSLILAFGVVLVALLITSYGNYDFAMQGLSPVMVVIVSEVFAVAAEAVLLALMARESLTGRQAVALSLLANAASFLAGLWVMGSR